jgi:hypothetical protein
VMDPRSGRRAASPVTLAVPREAADGRGPVRAHSHRGWSPVLTRKPDIDVQSDPS